MRGGRALRWLGGAAVAAGGLALVAVAGGVAFLRSPAGNRFLLAQLLPLAQPLPSEGGRVEIDGLETDLFSSLTLTGVRIYGPDGHQELSVATATARYRLGSLPARRLVVEELTLSGVESALTVAPTFPLATMWTGPADPTAPAATLPITLALSTARLEAPTLGLRVDGALYGLTDAQLDLSGKAWGAWEVALDAASLRAGSLILPPELGLVPSAGEAAPTLGPLSLALGPVSVSAEEAALSAFSLQFGAPGTLSLQGSGALALSEGLPLTLDLRAAQLNANQLPYLGRTLDAYGVNGRLGLTGSLQGPLLSPHANLQATTAGGPIGLDLRVDLQPETPTWALVISPETLGVADLLPRLPGVWVDGTLHAEGAGVALEEIEGSLGFDGTLGDVPALGAVEVSTRQALRQGSLGVEALDARWDTGHLALHGTLDPDDASGSLDIEALEVRAALLPRLDELRRSEAVAALLGDLLPSLEAAVAPLEGMEGTVRYTGRVDLGPQASPITLVGDASAEGLSLPGVGRVASATLPLEAVIGASVTARGLLTARGLEAAGVSVEQGTVEAALSGDDLTLDANLGALLTAKGAFNLASQRFSLPTLAATLPRPPGWPAQQAWPTVVWENTAPVVGTIAGAGVEGLDLRLHTGESLLSVSGALRWDGPAGRAFDAHVSLQGVPLAPHASWIDPSLATLGGGLSGELSLTGDRHAPRLDGDLTALAVQWPALLLPVDARAVVSASGSTLTLDAALRHRATTKTLDERLVASLRGTLPVALDLDGPQPPGLLWDQPAALSLLLPPQSAARLNHVLPGDLLPPMQLAAGVEWTGPLLAPDLRVRVGLDGDLDGEPFHVNLAADQSERTQLRLRATMLRKQERRVELSGVAQLDLPRLLERTLQGDTPDTAAILASLDQLALRLVPRQLEVAPLLALAGVDGKLSGKLSGGLLIKGSGLEPQVQGAVMLVEARADALPIEPALLAIQPTEGPDGPGYTVGLTLGFGADAPGKLTADGFLPFPRRVYPFPDTDALLSLPGLNLSVQGDRVPAAIAEGFTTLLAGTTGTFSTEARLTGRLADPLIDLRLALQDVGFLLPDLRTRYTGLTGAVRFTPTEISVSGLQGWTFAADRRLPSKLPLVPSLQAEFSAKKSAKEGAQWEKVDGGVVLDQFVAMAYPDTTLVLSGSLPVDGNERRVRIGGKVAVERARVLLGDSLFEDRSLSLDPAITVSNARPGPPPPAHASVASVEEYLAMIPSWLGAKVEVDLGYDTFGQLEMPMVSSYGSLVKELSQMDMSGTLSGEVTVEARTGFLSITGEVEPQQATATLMGREFSVTGGTLSFTGRDWMEPLLDMDAAYATGRYGDISLAIAGTPYAPTLSFSSADGLSDDDILSILLVGAPISDLGTGETGAAGDVLAQALFGLATSQLGGLSGTGALTSFSYDPTTGLRTGWSLNRDVTLFTALNPGADTLTENAYELGVEWRVGKDLTLEGYTGPVDKGFGLWRGWRF